MDFLDPLLDFIRSIKDPLLLVVGSVLAWIGGALQANRTNNLQIDRERREHYEKLLRLLTAEQERPLNTEDPAQFKEVRYLLSTIPPAQGKQRKKVIDQVQEKCLTALDWDDQLQVWGAFTYFMRKESLSVPGIHRGLIGHAIEVVNAAFHGNPLPEEPDFYERLRSIELKVAELDAEIYGIEEAERKEVEEIEGEDIEEAERKEVEEIEGEDIEKAEQKEVEDACRKEDE